jgi:hypothetical protein
MKAIIIRKIPPLDDFKRIVPKRFSRFPQLYLELLENKNKVKLNCIGKEFVPTTPPYATYDRHDDTGKDGKSSISNTPVRDSSLKEDSRDMRDTRDFKSSSRDSITTFQNPVKRTITVTNVKTVKTPNSISGMNGRNRLYDDDLFDDDRYKSPKPSVHGGRTDNSDIKLIPKTSNTHQYKKPFLATVDERGRRDEKRGDARRVDEREGKDRKAEIDNKKQSILRDEKRPETVDGGKKPPTLKEIENKKEKAEEVEENEEDKKRELLFKLQLLQKQYPLKTFPEFTIRSEYKSMKKTYDILVKQLGVDSSVETYKNYLIGGFMICEMGMGKVGFDMEGFTQQQLLSMNSYEELLIELGEKRYTPAGMDERSVEMRLALAIFFNAVWFVAAKMIMQKTKIDVLSLLNTTRGVGTASRSGTAPSSTRRHASPNGPEFNFIGRKSNGCSGSSIDSVKTMKGPSVGPADKDEGFGSDEGRKDRRSNYRDEGDRDVGIENV